jgi:hypothetical protein
LWHVKEPFIRVEFAFVGKITGHFSPIVPPFPAGGLSRRCRRGAPGGASGNFQSRASTISLHGCGTPRGTSHHGPMEGEVDK